MAAANSSAIKLLETPKLSFDRMPVLRSVFERLAADLGETLSAYCNETMTFFVNQIEPGNSWDILETYEDSIACIYKVAEWDTEILIGIDRRFVFSLTEAAFGADGSEPAFESGRAFSALELRLAREIINTVTAGFQSRFNRVSPVTFAFEKTATPLEFTVLGPTDMPALVVQLLFQVQDGGGRLFFLMPQSALYPIRRRLERETQPPPVLHDPRWTKHLKTEISKADVTLRAVLEGQTMTLGEIADLKPGQILPMKSGPKSLVTLMSGDEALFLCRAGQSDGVYTLMLEAPVAEPPLMPSGS